jgi:hypothetical protein
MKDPAAEAERLSELAGAICDEVATQADLAELDSILSQEPSRCWEYADYCRVHGALRLELRAHRAAQKGCRYITSELAPSAAGDSRVATDREPRVAPSYFASLFHGAFSDFPESMPVAYLLATVIMGAGLLVGAFTYTSPPDHIAAIRGRSDERRATQAEKPQLPVVGRITGLVDCQLANASAARKGGPVRLGRRFVLASGLVEITYDTGAKVLLQGPATYEVDSRNGGFMAVGTLVGRVNTEAARGLTIRTPTAVVTDLGTEFGVTVDKDGACEVHVIQGEVRAERVAVPDMQHAAPLPLRAGEAVRFTPAQPGPVSPKADAGSFKAMKTAMRRAQSAGRWPIVDKTLVAWVALADTDQRGAGVLSIAESPEFDGIVFGEIEPKRWMAGSHNYARTATAQSGWRPESAGANEFVQIAISYRDWDVTIYRNGERYAQYRADGRRIFNKHAVVLIGKRHPDIDTLTPPTLHGVVQEARLYNVSLSQEEVRSLKPGEPSAIAPIGLWNFRDGTARDAAGHFPPGTLQGNAKISNGQLILDGNGSYLLIPSAGESAVNPNSVPPVSPRPDAEANASTATQP